MPIDAKGQEVLHLKEVKDVANLYGQVSHHPFVGVFDLKVDPKVPPLPRVYGTFCLLLLNYSAPLWTYGRSSMKVLSGSVVCIAPGQYVLPSPPKPYTNLGVGLYFSPELIFGTHLGSLIWTYRFFDYKFNESVFLNDSERELYANIILQLREYIERNGDQINIIYVTGMIEKLMSILTDAFKRSKDLYREKTEDIFANFEDNLRNYLQNWDAHEKQVPKVSYFAEMEGLTNAHFGEAMKDLLGLNANQYIMNRMLMMSKEWLAQKKEAREVARRLGFSDAPHFSRFYVNFSGELPSAYKRRRLKELKKALSDNVESTETQAVTPPPHSVRARAKKKQE